ncbi:MAG: Hsp20/alpha crystallin family protein [Natronomonas sp.]
MTENPESDSETDAESSRKRLYGERPRGVGRQEAAARPQQEHETERSPEWPYAPTFQEKNRRDAPKAPPRLGLRACPDIDIVERSEEIHIWCDLPGCDEETIELSGDERTLHVSAQRAEEHWAEGDICRRERSKQAERSITLPARSDIDAAEASFDDGVLTIRAPKHESDHPRVIGIE